MLLQSEVRFSITIALLAFTLSFFASGCDNPFGYKAHLAATMGDEKVVATFLEKGATIEAEDENGYNLLHLAVKRGTKMWQNVLSGLVATSMKRTHGDLLHYCGLLK